MLAPSSIRWCSIWHLLAAAISRAVYPALDSQIAALTDLNRREFWLLAAVALFALGLLGVIVRRNLLVMLMCMELMLNGVNLSLVAFAQQTATEIGRASCRERVSSPV